MEIYESLLVIPAIMYTANLALAEVEKAVPMIVRILILTLEGILILLGILKGGK